MEEYKNMAVDDGRQDVSETDRSEINDAGVYIHKLSKPLQAYGTEYREIRLNFAGLTGEDCLKIDRELVHEGEIVYMRAVHPVFLLKACVKASGIGDDVLQMLPIKDYAAIMDQAKRFFMNVA